MAEFIFDICGVSLPDPFVAVFCVLFVLVFIGLIFSALKAVFGR